LHEPHPDKVWFVVWTGPDSAPGAKMFKNILKLTVAAIIVEAIIFFAISAFINNSINSGNNAVLSVAGLNAAQKSGDGGEKGTDNVFDAAMQGLTDNKAGPLNNTSLIDMVKAKSGSMNPISGMGTVLDIVMKGLSDFKLSSLMNSDAFDHIKNKPEARGGSKVVSKGFLKEPRQLFIPVWVNEGQNFKLTDDPVYVKITHIESGIDAGASVELVYPGGKSQVFEKFKRGSRKPVFGGKYSFELMNLKTTKDFPDWPRGANCAKIALYEKQ